MLASLENTLANFLGDTSQQTLPFPPKSDFFEKVARAVAARFRLAAHTEPVSAAAGAKKRIVLVKTVDSAVPTRRLAEVALAAKAGAGDGGEGEVVVCAPWGSDVVAAEGGVVGDVVVEKAAPSAVLKRPTNGDGRNGGRLAAKGGGSVKNVTEEEYETYVYLSVWFHEGSDEWMLWFLTMFCILLCAGRVRGSFKRSMGIAPWILAGLWEGWKIWLLLRLRQRSPSSESLRGRSRERLALDQGGVNVVVVVAGRRRPPSLDLGSSSSLVETEEEGAGGRMITPLMRLRKLTVMILTLIGDTVSGRLRRLYCQYRHINFTPSRTREATSLLTHILHLRHHPSRT